MNEKIPLISSHGNLHTFELYFTQEPEQKHLDGIIRRVCEIAQGKCDGYCSQETATGFTVSVFVKGVFDVAVER